MWIWRRADLGLNNLTVDPMSYCPPAFQSSFAQYRRPADRQDFRPRSEAVQRKAFSGGSRPKRYRIKDNTVFVTRLPHDADERTIAGVFGDVGLVVGVFLERNERGDSLNYAFVEFDNPHSVDQAIDQKNRLLVKGPDRNVAARSITCDRVRGRGQDERSHHVHPSPTQSRHHPDGVPIPSAPVYREFAGEVGAPSHPPQIGGAPDDALSGALGKLAAMLSASPAPAPAAPRSPQPIQLLPDAEPLALPWPCDLWEAHLHHALGTGMDSE